MSYRTHGNLNAAGNPEAPILIITDAPHEAIYQRGDCMSAPQMALLKAQAEEHGLSGSLFQILTPCPPIPEGADSSDRKLNAFVDGYREELADYLQTVQPHVRLIVAFGKIASRQVFGKPVKITKIRGSFADGPLGIPVLPMYSPAHVLRLPEVRPIFISDFSRLAACANSGWDTSGADIQAGGTDYHWSLDLTEWLDDPPDALTCDTETLGLRWTGGRKAILTVQLTRAEGTATVVPLCPDYFNNPALRGKSTADFPKLTASGAERLTKQLRQLLGNPAVRVAGHNFKFDLHHLRNYGIEVANWYADSLQLAWAADENMDRHSLDECIRRWAPALSGYADAFNVDPVHHGKSRMDLVPHDAMLAYGGGDTDACFRLLSVLSPLVRKDQRQWNVFRRVQMAALRLFVDMEEAGVEVDKDALRELGIKYAAKQAEAYKRLIDAAVKKAPAVMRRHEEAGLAFSRPAFVGDLLFSEDGFGLTPKVWTKSTRKGPKEEKVPSVSSKDHLPFFDHIPFVRELIEYQKNEKLLGTYIGNPATEIISPIKRNAKGELVKSAKEALTEAGMGFRAVVPPPARQRAKPTPRGPIIWLEPEAPNTIGVDAPGNVWKRETTEATGFWKYLLNGDVIHPTFYLDGTVTGRTACVSGDTLVRVRRLGTEHWKAIALVGEGDEVWTHAERWRPVLAGYVKPAEEMWEVTFSNGQILRATEEHKLLTEDGRWVTLRHVCLQETFKRPGFAFPRGHALSRILADHGASSDKRGSIAPHGMCDPAEINQPRSLGEVEGHQVFGEQTWEKQSDEREATAQLPGNGGGWTGLPNGSGGWKTVFRASGGVCPIAVYQSGGLASESCGAPHRRGHDQQSPGQLGTGNESRAPGASRKVCEAEGGVRITGFKPCGVHQVYDIQVADDHSYEAAGCFSHNSREPNAQNWPKRGPAAKDFRRIFIPGVGYLFVECDLSQAELRLAACMANERNMLRIYQNGGDIHMATGGGVMGISLEQMKVGANDDTPLIEVANMWPGSGHFLQTQPAGSRATVTVKAYVKQLRQQAKAVNFGFLYGMWWKKFMDYAKTEYGVVFTPKQAEETRERFFTLYPGLVSWHEEMREFVRKNGFVRAQHGALRRLPSVHSDDEAIRAETERQAINSPIQRFASDLGLIGASRFRRDCPSVMQVVAFIHDASIVRTPEKDALEAAGALKYYMQNTPLADYFDLTLPIPIIADVSIGDRLDTVKERPDIPAMRPIWYCED